MQVCFTIIQHREAPVNTPNFWNILLKNVEGMAVNDRIFANIGKKQTPERSPKERMSLVNSIKTGKISVAILDEMMHNGLRRRKINQ